ncbi:MAG: hypothetical protein KGL53_06915 [Elusimicrobia bacterium]|nr:hypothetical protein [Elusimicrobiota bacterium]
MTKLALAPLCAAAMSVGAAAFAAGGMKMSGMHHHAAMKGSQSVSVKGEVLDMACYMGHGEHGDKHAECAMACISGGAPAGLLTHDGKVFLLVADHAKEKPYKDVLALAGHMAEVSGTRVTRGGLTAIVVEESKKG